MILEGTRDAFRIDCSENEDDAIMKLDSFKLLNEVKQTDGIQTRNFSGFFCLIESDAELCTLN